ncbi:uncharacterized protein LOC130798923 [Amaranthus tricolor]|uniref:uncharacterized protein LOC130798923 n=1 Tax=Amaranthus tricolor TaxID=29722 RepID=UPI00258ED229|nr:uncharacterized protein LOC130798923 [Amaranthus tricolor]
MNHISNRLGVDELAEKDNIVLLSKAGSDDFLYTMADDVHAEASAIILGSLWNNEFCFFCYGRQAPATTSTNSFYANFNLYLSNSFYAWELPSAFLVSAQDCPCGDCLINEEFSKENLPGWIAWQSKRQLVLGFLILRKNLCSLLPEIGEHGGFTLVRLMSNGTLQSQQYCASWEMTCSILTTAHGEMSQPCRDSLLCSMGDEEYKYRRRFHYIKLENLHAHLNDKIGKSMFTKFISGSAGRLCEYEPTVSHLDVDVFMDVNMPTSLYEIVSRLMWTALHVNVLKEAFPDHSEVVAIKSKKVPPEFPVIPEGNQLPPFFLRKPYSGCSNKQGEDIVGPVLPLSVSLVLKEIKKHGNSFVDQVNDFSTEYKFTRLCEYVVNFTMKKFTDDLNKKQDKNLEETWVDDSAETGLLLWYKPTSFMDEVEEQKN